MRIYTRTGDRGQTSLFGGQRVAKNDPRVAAYGDVDELNSLLGLCRLHTPGRDPLDPDLASLQAELFTLGADLATPRARQEKTPRVGPEHASRLEAWIDRYQDQLPPQTRFVLPGGAPAGATLHLARTVCRRAERTLLDLMEETEESEEDFLDCLVYLNRLSDLLFSMARYANHSAPEGPSEVFWDPPPLAAGT